MFAPDKTTPAILDLSIRRAIEAQLKPRHLKSMDSLVDEMMHGIMEQIPVQAFEERLAHHEGYLVFQQDVDQASCENMQYELLSAHMSLPIDKPINMMLSTFGGDWEYGLAVMGVMHRIQSEGRDVNVHVTGSASSMGSIITQAGTRRYMDEFADMMLHEGSGGLPINYRQAKDYMEGWDKTQKSMYRIYASRSGKTPEYWENRVSRHDVFLTAQEALEEKLIDEIIYSPFTTAKKV